MNKFNKTMAAAIAACCSAFAPAAHSQTLDLDFNPTYGRPGATSEMGYDLAIEPSTGKIFVAVTSDDDADESGNNIGIVLKFNANGKSLDAAFGNDGVVEFDTPSASDEVYGLALQGNGQLVVAGKSDSRPTLWRLNGGDGSADNSFGTGGKASISTEIGTFRDVALQSDGKPVASGYGFTDNSKFCYLVARFSVAGSLDPTFNGVGFKKHRVGSTSVMEDWGAGWAIAIAPDGSILTCGYEESTSGTGQNATILKLKKDGTLDLTFSTDGVWTSQGMDGVQYFYDLLVDSAPGGERVVAAGYTKPTSSSNTQTLMVALKKSGDFDNLCNQVGLVLLDPSVNDERTYCLAALSSDNYLLGGRMNYVNNIRRLNMGCAVNTDWGFSGEFPIAVDNAQISEHRRMAIHNGCLYTVGSFTKTTSIFDYDVFLKKTCLGSVGSQQSEVPAEAELFPNPAAAGGDIFLKLGDGLTGEVEVWLTDLSGRLVWREKFDSRAAGGPMLLAPDRQLESGFYAVQILANNRVTVKRLAVSR